MKFKTKVTFKEYLRLLLSLAYEKPMMKLLVGVAALIVLWIIFYYANILDLPEPIIYQYITLALIVIAQPIILYTTIRRNYQSSNHLRETLEMEIQQEHMTIEGVSFYMEVKWDKMHKIIERPKYFLVYQNNLSAIIIPKKDLPPADIEKFRVILNDLEDVKVEVNA